MRVTSLETRVELVQAYTGMSDRVVRCASDGDTRGLAIVAFGRGNVPPAIVPALADAIGGGILTISSRCVAGRVRPRYGYEGGGRHLMQIGAVLAGDLSGAKARLLQMVALRVAGDSVKARELIAGVVE
jgi:L-asparaginase